METKQEAKFYHDVINTLNHIKGIKIKNSKLFNLKNYKDISFAEVVISFLKSDVKCPQGYLFEKDNYKNGSIEYYKNGSVKHVLGASNLYDLRSTLQIKTSKFDYFNLSRDIFLRKMCGSGLDERVVINCSDSILIGQEENNLESILELKKKTDLSPPITISKEERKRYTRLHAYLNNNIKKEYIIFSIHQ